ncbi:MAG: hypothetical protein ING40_05535 [Burkholderiales bacterium]|nr:hypothetical protein [Burkholderiales bacterium]MCA3228482.1 hypothetical protein [Burkholderiales bacterium]
MRCGWIARHCDAVHAGVDRGSGLSVLLQAEASECALACLAMIASAHGLHTDLADLRRRFCSQRKINAGRSAVRVK